jgi:predicted dehydrogenase/branched-subunit amino acid aminotransferase/4-amino-4-deoxychorismate lyase
MATAEPLVYLRGRLVPASQANISIYDFGIVLGATVTDLLRTFHRKTYRLEDHVRRFYESCKYARIAPPIPADETATITEEIVRHNAEIAGPDAELCVVYFITAGENLVYAGSAAAGGATMLPTLCIHSFPIPFQLFRRFFESGLHLVTPSTRHVPPECIDPKIKHRSRLHWWLAEQEAHLVDSGAMPLLLDLQGNLTETSGSNVLLVKNGVVYSPNPRNILLGISRKVVIELCSTLSIPFRERDLQIHDALTADEVFVATTPYCLAPVTKVNGVTIGDGAIGGPVYDRLLEAWSREVGVDIRGQGVHMKVLVVGGGSMGRRRLRDLTYLYPGGVLLLEPVSERCKQVSTAFGIPGFSSLETAMEQGPDALAISTPPALHEPYVRAALDHGKHVFAEVPFLLDYNALHTIAATFAKDDRKTILGVSHTIRYYPPYRLIHDLVHNGAVGRPLYLEYSLGNYLPDWHPYEDYRKFYASDQKMGGAGMDMLLHEISAIHWWLGPAAQIQARLAKVSSLEISGPDTHDILIRFANGAVGFFHHDIIERGTIGRHTRIVGEEGTIEWHQNQPTIRIFRGRENRNDELGFDQASDWLQAMEASREAGKLLAAQRAASGEIPAATAPSFTYESCYLREMRHFMYAVAGKAPYTGCTVDEELKTVAAFHAVLQSAEQGRELDVA